MIKSVNLLPELSFSRFIKIQILTKQPAEGKILSTITHAECGLKSRHHSQIIVKIIVRIATNASKRLSF